MSTATPKQRVQASILATIGPEIAERIYQYDKANPAARLSDLLDDDERAIYMAEVLDLFSPERRHERMTRFNALRAHGHAIASKEDQELDLLVKHDRIRYNARGSRQYFGRVSHGYCMVCRERVQLNAVTVWIESTLYADAHGLCCAKDDMRFVWVNEFIYQLRGEL